MREDPMARRSRPHQEAYRYSEWARPEEAARVRRLVPQPPQGFELDRERPHFDAYHAERVTRYRFIDPAPRRPAVRAVQVVVAECQSAEAARRTLMDILQSTMAARPERRDEPGEIAFVAPGPEPTWLVFSRGAVTVKVESIGTVPVPVLGYARELDEALLS